jgi:hypothetical protein
MRPAKGRQPPAQDFAETITIVKNIVHRAGGSP